MHRLSVRMLHSFSRSGETMLLRALAAHPMIHVVHDLAATNTPVEQQLASRIRFKGENEIPADDPAFAGRDYPEGSIVVLKNAIWTPRFPVQGFVLARNPFSVILSIGGFSERKFERRERRRVFTHLYRYLRKIEVPPTEVREKLARWSRHIDPRMAAFVRAAEPVTGLARLYDRKMVGAFQTGDPILRYETFVKNPETPLRALIAHFGLPWDERVVKSHEAYRQGEIGHGGIKLWEPIHGGAVDSYKKIAPPDIDLIYALTAPACASFGYGIDKERQLTIADAPGDRFLS